MACGWNPLACAIPATVTLNLLVIARQPYTKYPGAVLALPAGATINAQPVLAVTSGLPWVPVLSGRPNATCVATGARAAALRAPFYAEFGPAVQNAVIVSFPMTAPEVVPGTAYKEAKGVLVAYPRAPVGAAAAATAAQAAALGFVFRWWCGGTASDSALPDPFEVVTSTAVSVRFTVLSQPVVVDAGGLVAETCVLVLAEQACPPAPACLAPCPLAPPPYLGTTVGDVAEDALGDVVTLSLTYGAYAGVTNLRVNPIMPDPEDTSVVVQEEEGAPGGPVRITFMFRPESEVGRVEFTVTGDIVSPSCVHAADATTATSQPIVLFVACPPPVLTAPTAPDTLGPTCALVDWEAPGPGTYQFSLQANPPLGSVVSGTVTDTQTPLVFTDLNPITPYELTVSGGPCGARAPSATLPFTTLEPVSLGPFVEQVEVVPSVDGPPDTCDLLLRYEDYSANCVTIAALTNASYTNPPPGWTGQVTMMSPFPFEWQVTQVPYLTTAYFEVVGTCEGCLCPGCTTLRQQLTVNTPAPPPVDCGVEATPLPSLVTPAGAYCLTFTWTPNRVFAKGYDWFLEPGSFSNHVPNHDSEQVSVSGLQSDTDYTFTLQGVCHDGSLSAPSAIPAATATTLVPDLGPIAPVVRFTTWVPTTNSYTATVTTQPVSAAVCAAGPVKLALQPNQSILPQPVITQQTATSWTVTGVPANADLLLQFTAQPVGASPVQSCTGRCAVGAAVPALPFSATAPAAPDTPCATQSLTASVKAGSRLPTCTIIVLAYSPSSNFTGFTWTLESGGPPVPGTSPAGTTTIPLEDLVPDTDYTFTVTGSCAGGGTTLPQQVPFSTPAETAPSLAPWTQTANNPVFTQHPDGSVSAHVQYPMADAVCLAAGDPVLEWAEATPPGAAIVALAPAGGNLLWNVTGLAANTAYTLQLTASGAGNAGETCPVCTSSTAALTPVAVDFTTSTDPPPPLADAPFLLAITNYQGPPDRVIGYGKNLSETPLDTWQATYHAQESDLIQVYTDQVMNGFIKYHMNTPIVIGTNPPFYLPISVLFIGHAGDPTVQGTNTPATSGGNYSILYNTAMPAPSPYVDPPYLQLYIALATYNWEAANGVHPNPRQIAMANNHYGSSKGGEQWWFNLSVTTSGPDTGVITPATPSDPKAVPSRVDGIANDGNGAGTGITLAGWNCLEAWFAYVAYLNQQLRRAIASGQVRTTTTVMTLDDLTQDNAKYYQISAITADQEGGGFANTLYPTRDPGPGQYWEPWFVTVSSADCNFLMTSLWNKWVNQATVLDTPAPPLLPVEFTPYLGNLVVAAPRAVMPATPFTLPCAVSLTTPGMIKDMTVADLGSPDFSAVSNIMFEIYDTSDTAPFLCLGANTAPVSCTGPNPQTGVTGAPFTPAIYTNAHPTSSADIYAQYPQSFLGVWDNLIAAPAGCSNALQLNSTGTGLTGGGGLGSFTAFNNHTLQIAPRIATADATNGFDPWTYTASPWITRYVIGGAISSLGWALEGSRYDLFNGYWASKAAAATGKPLSYDAVAQGANDADGTEVIEDLTTGLKGRCARGVLSVGTGGTGSLAAAASRCVWMLSNEAGPFVDTANNAFACPDSALELEAPESSSAWPGWPGWMGMRGQLYGPGNGTQSAPVRWNLNQMNLGQYDPSPTTVVGSNCSENNFGVFADFHIQVAAWLALARDMRGEGVYSGGICNGAFQYSDATKPLMGCYELAFMPLSWFGPTST
jgi:hypothetical protein